MSELLLSEADVVFYGARCARRKRIALIVGPYVYAALAAAYLHWDANQRLDDDGCPLHKVQR